MSIIGSEVKHPLFGQGRIVAVYRDGKEWMVRFDSGLRFRRVRDEFALDGAMLGKPKPRIDHVYRPPAPMPYSQLEARQFIESLRLGIAPAQHVPELTINLQAERESIVQALSQAHQNGGAVRAVVGEYGYGKSHLVELTAQEALARHFLVATVSLDLLELPPHRSFDIYREAMPAYAIRIRMKEDWNPCSAKLPSWITLYLN